MFKLLTNEKLLFFVGGIAATIAGAKAIKSGTTYKLGVKGLAAAMAFQKRALETFQNMKEDAEDICLDADKNEN